MTAACGMAAASSKDIVDGFDAFPETLLRLFKGENVGKLLIRVAGD